MMDEFPVKTLREKLHRLKGKWQGKFEHENVFEELLSKVKLMEIYKKHIINFLPQKHSKEQ